MYTENKLKVFLSSKCGDDDTFKVIRTTTKQALDETGLFSVYMFEQTASTHEIEDSYLAELDESHVCLFYINENVDLPLGVAKEIKRAVETEKKSLFVFLKGNVNKKTRELVIEKGFCKFAEINAIEEFTKKGYDSIIDDLIGKYRDYCRGRLSLNKQDEREIEIEHFKETNYKVEKAFFNGFKKTYNFFDEYVIGSEVQEQDNDRTTSDLDALMTKLFPTFIENSPIDSAALELLGKN